MKQPREDIAPTIPTIDPKMVRIGEELGSGLDKIAFEAFDPNSGKRLPVVVKRQHARAPQYRGGQTTTEMVLQDRLMREALEGSDTAKAALSRLALIVAKYWDTEYGWVAVQERVRCFSSGYEYKVLSACMDAGGRNTGRHLVTRRLVICDWGIEQYSDMEELGVRELEEYGPVA